MTAASRSVREQQEQRNAATKDTASAADSGPTEKQIDYLLALAESVGVRVDVSNVKEKRTASEIIDALKVLRQHGLGNTEAASGGHGQNPGFDIATTKFASGGFGQSATKTCYMTSSWNLIAR